MTLKLILAFVIAFAVSAVVGFFLVPYLKRIKAGQSIKENGPTWHMSKQGTPTMGGLMFIAAIAVVCLSVGFECMAEGEYGHLFCLAFALVFGAIGFLDDYEKLKKKQNLGLTAGKKLLLQLAAAVAFIFLMRRFGYVALDSLYIPFWNKTVPVSEPLYVIFAAFVIVGTVNSVNLTDGVDGLAASTTMPVCIFFAVISMLWGERFLSLGVFASGLAGGLLGFLIYNFHPAKVFMGDTGSLFLGGAVAALAFAYDMPLILVTLGIMYIIEALSDIIQVGYFKLTHGKRVFKMSPFHHHLEMGGWTGHKWKETQIVALFAGVTVLFAVLSFIGVFHRFGVRGARRGAGRCLYEYFRSATSRAPGESVRRAAARQLRPAVFRAHAAAADDRRHHGALVELRPRVCAGQVADVLLRAPGGLCRGRRCGHDLAVQSAHGDLPPSVAAGAGREHLPACRRLDPAHRHSRQRCAPVAESRLYDISAVGDRKDRGRAVFLQHDLHL